VLRFRALDAEGLPVSNAQLSTFSIRENGLIYERKWEIPKIGGCITLFTPAMILRMSVQKPYNTLAVMLSQMDAECL
jgi:hypothetical protein